MRIRICRTTKRDKHAELQILFFEATLAKFSDFAQVWGRMRERVVPSENLIPNDFHGHLSLSPHAVNMAHPKNFLYPLRVP